MSNKIELSCDCGSLRGHAVDVSPKTGRHIICMCKDCQAFARSLGREADILDQNGGTEIFQITPSQIKLETGLDHLAATRLSPKGALRWYASCCNTPIANTAASAGLPFAGVFCKFIKTESAARETALGPIQARFFASEGYGKIPVEAQNKVSIGTIAKTIVWMLSNKLRGKANPSPFFTTDKSPAVEPHVLSKDARDRFTTAPTEALAG